MRRFTVVLFVAAMLLAAIIPAAAQDAAPSPISYGEAVTGTISEEVTSVYYEFTGSAGDIITITMVADPNSGLDTYLYLYTLDDFRLLLEPIVENDDAANSSGIGNFDSRIANFTLPEDGNYVIEASNFSGTGDFTLTLDAGEAASGPTVERIAIAYGETVTGIISDETPSVYYEFEGSAGDIVTITMVASEISLDPTLVLYTLAELEGFGNALAENDDAEDTTGIGTFDSRIPNFELPEDTTYIIEATRFGGTGGYELTLESGDAAATPAEVEPEKPAEEPAFEGAQVIVLDDGASDASVIIPEAWVSTFDMPFTVVSSSEEAGEVFSDETIPVPAGEVAIAFATPETLAQLPAAVEEETLNGYMTTIADLFSSENEIMEYGEFEVPAVMLSLEGAPDAPDNANTFIIEVDGAFFWVVTVSGGEFSEFEARIVEVVNSLAGVVPSYATPVEGEATEATEEQATEEESGQSPAPDGAVDLGDGLFVTLPEGFVSRNDLPFTYAATSEETLEVVEAGSETPAAGELGLSFVVPSGLGAFGLTADSTVLEVAETLNTRFEATGEVTTYDELNANAAISFLEDSVIAPEGALLIVVESSQGPVVVAVQPGQGETLADVEDVLIDILNSISD